MSFVKKINLQYALGEIFLIFVGISLAIWFHNWNDGRKNAHIERQTLIEIREGIRKDKGDIELNIQGHQKRLKVYSALIETLENDLPMSGYIDSNFTLLFGYTSFITNHAPYETLKSRGIDIISSDSLRNDILVYYDVKMEWIVFNEQDHISHYKTVMKDLLMKHADFSSGINVANFSSLKADDRWLPALYWARYTDYYIYQLYKDLAQHAENLLLDLSNEIDASS